MVDDFGTYVFNDTKKKNNQRSLCGYYCFKYIVGILSKALRQIDYFKLQQCNFVIATTLYIVRYVNNFQARHFRVPYPQNAKTEQ